MLAQDPHTAAKNPASPPILVVDDEPLMRWSVGETLTARGYAVTEAADAQSAVRAFGDGKHTDLVLLDLRLPDADDLRVLARLRATSPGTPVIVMTAFATREIIEEAAMLGASVLTKPFDLSDLADGVQAALKARVY